MMAPPPEADLTEHTAHYRGVPLARRGVLTAQGSLGVPKAVPFPSEDESTGVVSMAWRGPAYADQQAWAMLRLLWSYLTDSAVAPLTKGMVEIDAPFCSRIGPADELFSEGYHQVCSPWPYRLRPHRVWPCSLWPYSRYGHTHAMATTRSGSATQRAPSSATSTRPFSAASPPPSTTSTSTACVSSCAARAASGSSRSSARRPPPSCAPRSSTFSTRRAPTPRAAARRAAATRRSLPPSPHRSTSCRSSRSSRPSGGRSGWRCCAHMCSSRRAYASSACQARSSPRRSRWTSRRGRSPSASS